MTAYLSTLKQASFDDLAFPVEKVAVAGAMRHHVHEYPHSAGGKVEKLGRKLYSVKMSCIFHRVPGSKLDQLYPDLYPFTLYNLRSTFEDGKTSNLVIPTVGTIRAFCINWSQLADMRNSLSGEAVELEFTEDQETENLLENKYEFGTGEPSLAEKSAALEIETKALTPKPDIFDAIKSAVDAVLVLTSTADIASRLLEAKLLRVAELCRLADREVQQLQRPSSWRVLEALKEVWAEAQRLAVDLLRLRAPLVTYTVPARMGIAAVAANIYGDSSRAMELLRLNEVDDVFALPAGKEIRHYARVI